MRQFVVFDTAVSRTREDEPDILAVKANLHCALWLQLGAFIAITAGLLTTMSGKNRAAGKGKYGPSNQHETCPAGVKSRLQSAAVR